MKKQHIIGIIWVIFTSILIILYATIPSMESIIVYLLIIDAFLFIAWIWGLLGGSPKLKADQAINAKLTNKSQGNIN